MGCAGECAEVVEPTCKPAADAYPFEIDLFEYVAIRWQPNRQYTAGMKVHPPVPNGFVLEAQNIGTSGGELPPFDAVEGEQFTDGSVVWELVAATEDDINEASAPDYSVDPADSGDLDVADLVIANGRYLRGTYLAGVAGTVYEAAFVFTVDGLERGFTQRVTAS